MRDGRSLRRTALAELPYAHRIAFQHLPATVITDHPQRSTSLCNTSRDLSNMEPRTPESPSKRMLHNFSKAFKFRNRTRKRLAAPDYLNCPTTELPPIPQDPSQQIEALVSISSVPAQSVQALVGHRGPTTDSSPKGRVASTTVPSVIPGRILTPRTSEAATVLSPTAQPSADQVTKFTIRRLLAGLSSAADGVPIPGVKVIFDTIISVLDIIEVRKLNCLPM